MDASAVEGVEVGRHSRDQGLAFPGFHLRHHSPVKRERSDDLNIEVSLAQHSFGCFPNRRKRFDGQIVQGLTVRQTLTKIDGAGRQLRVGQTYDVGLGGVDLDNDLLEFLEGAAFTSLQNLGKERHGRPVMLSEGQG